MPSETPKLDELLKDSPHFTKVSREMFAVARAELAALRAELNDLDRLCARQSKLLTDAINVLRGKPDELHMHSHHDIAKHAAALREQLKQARKYLLRYGRHDDGSIDDMENCKSHECGPDTCDCGLDAAILALKGS